MKKDRRWLAWLITLAIGLALAAGVLASRGGFDQTTGLDMMSALCDACFVPGIMLTGVGILVLVASDGFFDILSYGAHSLLVLFSALRSPEKHESYYDFKTRRTERRKRPDRVVLWSGLIFLAAAVVFLIIYYSMLNA
ncbi:MAG: DUF3899 domain-containing protein [Christensenellaceae bacterium]|nr:DUF3899 domain-containing protein [Christensenellaceae bacterium]